MINPNSSYTVTARDAIRNAVLEAGLISDNEEVPGHMYDWMLHRVNLLLKHMQAQGLQVFNLREIMLRLRAGQGTYKLGPNLSQESPVVILRTYVTLVDDYDTDEEGNRTPTGKENADGSLLQAPLVEYEMAPRSSAAENFKPLGIHNIRLFVDNEHSKAPTSRHIEHIPRDRFYLLGGFETPGEPNEVYFRPDINYSELRVHPVPVDNYSRLLVTVEHPMTDIVSGDDQFSVPNWWLEPLHLSFAYAAATGYNAMSEKIALLRVDRDTAMRTALDYDIEEPYVKIEPDPIWLISGV